MKPKTILIKKYENRRLYDTTHSRYMNLDEVAKMMQSGGHVRVVDASTGKDITRLILTQIIVEDAKTPDSTFPLDVLRQMVITAGQASRQSALEYLKTMIDLSKSAYSVVPPELNPFEFVQRKDAAQRVLGESPPASPAGKIRAPQGKDSNLGEVDELKQRLAELETIVAKLAPRKAPRKKR